MRRLLVLAMMLVICLAVPAQRRNQQRRPTQKEQLQERQRRLRQQQQQNRQRQQQLEQQVRQRMKDVEALGSEIDDKQMLIDSLHVEMDTLNSTIARLDSQLVVLKNELEERRQHYVQSVRYMYRNRNAQHQAMFVFSAQNLNQMYRRMRFMNEYTTYQRAQGEAVKQKGEQVAAKLDELNAARSELAALVAKGEQEQRLLEAKKGEQQRLVANLQREQQTVKKLIAQQQREEAEVTRQIDRIIAEELEKARKAEEERQRQLAEQRRREQEQAAAANANAGSNNRRNSRRRNGSATPATPATPTYRDADPDRQLTGSFAGNKGRLPVPITGSYRVIRNFGPYTMAGVTLQSNGIQLEGQAGAQARCVFDGEVSRIFNSGNSFVVMVRHGRYISVYSNLASASVSMGQKVKTNQILGTVGANHVLMFRLQNWDKLLNPKAWLSRLSR